LLPAVNDTLDRTCLGSDWRGFGRACFDPDATADNDGSHQQEECNPC